MTSIGDRTPAITPRQRARMAQLIQSTDPDWQALSVAQQFYYIAVASLTDDTEVCSATPEQIARRTEWLMAEAVKGLVQ